MDRVWRVINERLAALEKVVDALAARVSKVDQKPKPKPKSKSPKK